MCVLESVVGDTLAWGNLRWTLPHKCYWPFKTLRGGASAGAFDFAMVEGRGPAVFVTAYSVFRE